MKKLLDVGCGPGTVTNSLYYKKFIDRYTIYGIDIGKKNIDTIRKRWPSGLFRVGDAQHLPYRDNYFDIIISRHTLEHVKDMDQVMNEMYRVCKRNGMIFLAVPTEIFEKTIVKFIPHYMGSHHERVIKPTELEHTLTRHRFTVLRRTQSKWPMFVFIIVLAWVSHYTRKLSMEMQTGLFRNSHNTYVGAFPPSSFLFASAAFFLFVLETLFWFLNSIIPWEVEIVARKRMK